MSQGLNLLEYFGAGGPRKFIDTLDRGKRGIAVKEDQLASGLGGRVNDHFNPRFNPVEEIDHVLPLQADAATARGRSDLFLVIGSMDVDVAIEGIEILRIEAFETEDAGKNQIVMTLLTVPGAIRFAATEDGVGRSAFANLVAYPETPGRRAITSLIKAHPLGGRGDGPALNDLVSSQEGQFLSVDGDFDAVGFHRETQASE